MVDDDAGTFPVPLDGVGVGLAEEEPSGPDGAGVAPPLPPSPVTGTATFIPPLQCPTTPQTK
ncbi:hypothetical protein HanPSC8_Chr09g0365241 [Helianthus annuus]|nr:hypothetical protein HanPSC8_Chr09g0365241 [Helianthus annuus]